ncbi:MAG: hypothetical protein HY904_24345 [Deltaproteobacteria bacterium]|nr:hypothetical protein [Deltaproteobacteria bacterium]
MPELPEVELHRRHLRGWLCGRVVVRAVVRPAGLLKGSTAGSMTRALRRVRFLEPTRLGKHLLLPTDGGAALYVHLGMTGHLSRRRAAEPAPRYAVMSLELDDGHVVDLTDPRRFSVVGMFAAGCLPPPMAKLGPDLLDAPPTAAELVQILSRTGKAIKVALMEQERVAGLGNIHAAEALWRARIHPDLPARALTLPQARALLRGIRGTLDLVLQDDDGEAVYYVEVAGNPNPFRLYDREGEPCPRCRGPIARDVHGGRSTYWCPRCQPLSSPPPAPRSRRSRAPGSRARG